MPKKQLSIGLIGGGMIADVHIERIKRDKRGKVTWLAERNPTTLAEKLAKHRIKNGTADHRAILDDPEVCAVIIATPPGTHADLAIEALRAGKHVLIEKPMAHQRGDLKRLIAAASKHPKQVLLDCSCRHSRLQPKFRYLKAIIDAGEIGQVYHIHHQHLVRSTFLDWNPKGTWARKKALAGGGPLLDWGVYDLAFHLGLLSDKPHSPVVHAFTRNGLKLPRDGRNASDVEEHAAALLEFENGLTYYYERGAGVHLEAANETRIAGTRGGLRFSFPTWESSEIEVFKIDRRGNETHEIRRVPGKKQADDHLVLTRHFIDCIEGIAQPTMPVTLAAKHLEILFKIFVAAERAEKRIPRAAPLPSGSPEPTARTRKPSSPRT